jgi:NADH dehydrogenase [ubiquinone] 1 alpha subcomplex assembly factor 5
MFTESVSMLQDIKRSFNTVLDLGSGPGHLSKLLESDKVKKAIMLDSSGMVPLIPAPKRGLTRSIKLKRSIGTPTLSSKVRRTLSSPALVLTITSVAVERIHGDEENLLQHIERNSQEAVLSCLSLHWVNDLPGELLPPLRPFKRRADKLRQACWFRSKRA